MTTMTDTDRINTANQIADQLATNGIGGKTYAPMTDGVARTVRVYVDRSGIKAGHLVVGRDGRIDIDGIKGGSYEAVKRIIGSMGLIAYRGAGR